MLGVPAQGRVGVSAGDQLLAGVCAQRFEQPEACLPAGRIGDDERFLHQPVE
ncbi:MAG: hypothetical protein ACR2PL_14405 [Dehalococcoidia bacterium]